MSYSNVKSNIKYLLREQEIKRLESAETLQARYQPTNVNVTCIKTNKCYRLANMTARISRDFKKTELLCLTSSPPQVEQVVFYLC